MADSSKYDELQRILQGKASPSAPSRERVVLKSGEMEAFPSQGYGPKMDISIDLPTQADGAVLPADQIPSGPPPGFPPPAAMPPNGFALNDPALTAPTLAETTPPLPRTIEETGLSAPSIVELLVKCLYFGGEMSGNTIADSICLPFTAIVYPLLLQLKDDRLVEIKGGGGSYTTNWRFALTKAGADKAQEIMARNQYSGPAPVSLKDYATMVSRQFFNQGVNYDDVRGAFRELVVPEDLIEKVGSAVNSCKSIFMYGPPGNGKTSVAERICRMLHGAIFVPFAIEVGGQIIKLYDPMSHLPPDNNQKPPSAYDRRWILVKRPLVIVGGELTLSMLDLTYNESEKFYEAPFQLKSNGGMLLIDDFGRQLVHPKDLLNRWIVPLEKGLDYLTLHTGQKFEAPFRQLVVFSTNMNPKDLVDEAFLRRMRYKIEIADPTEANFRSILRRTCEAKGVAFTEDGLNHIRDRYRKENVPMRACHPRDLVEIILDKSRFLRCAPTLDESFVSMAWSAYFVRY